MKKITIKALMIFSVCFGSGCDNKRGGSDNDSTPTEKIGIGEGDEIITGVDDSDISRAADSAEISTGAPATYMYNSDDEFVSLATSGGILEVELGRIAAQKGVAAEVKKFGQQMAEDHTKAKTELRLLAGKKEWGVPARMNPEDKAVFDRISNLSGPGFDRAYMAQMVTSHEKTIAMFEKANQKASDKDLRSYASKTLPTLRTHLDLARDNNNKLQSQ